MNEMGSFCKTLKTIAYAFNPSNSKPQTAELVYFTRC